MGVMSVSANTNEGDTGERLKELRELLSPCRLCPRQCEVDRLSGERGFCRIGAEALMSSAGPHFGEEPPLVGSGGSGTIFFAGCNLGCVFCQNHDISHGLEGNPISPSRLADVMLYLQKRGCHNINVVTPTHVVPWIVEALSLARSRGLNLPLVYNCGGYESVETLRLLDGLVDIYMPDFKFADSAPAERFAQAPDYPETAMAALKEMHRQVGDLDTVTGVAKRGLLVRHLVMPAGVAGSRKVIDFLAGQISPHTAVNVMAQYRPCYRAYDYEEIARRPSFDEFTDAYNYAVDRGLRLLR